ncbi:hypothetical protein NL30_36320 [Burkholderia contaminans]|uniref:hypothetical protein n=1 Tax=Burkholderia contaminans TaxID=488447 RepID=UPI00064A66EF|nr:hypothetical protein [Burkholderia contaminans]AKM45310.1 hypothetical protein NL30_36320 [Burkholderia contaminans]
MALIQIPARHHDRYPTAGLNPAQVVAVYRLPVISDGTLIALNARDPKPADGAPHGRVRTLVWTAPVAVVLADLAAAGTTLVPVELVHITEGTPVDHHVNPAAIVAVQPLATGNGRVWLTNGEDLFVTAAALQVLAAHLIAPAAAVAAGTI